MDEMDLPLTDEQKEELDRRWRALEANPDEGVPWEELKKSLLPAGETPASRPARTARLDDEG